MPINITNPTEDEINGFLEENGFTKDNVNQPTADSQLPLHTAINENEKSIVKWLVEHGADVNQPLPYFDFDDSGNDGLMPGLTPLSIAAGSNGGDTTDRSEIIFFLLNNGADINLPNLHREETCISLHGLNENALAVACFNLFASENAYGVFGKRYFLHDYNNFCSLISGKPKISMNILHDALLYDSIKKLHVQKALELLFNLCEVPISHFYQKIESFGKPSEFYEYHQDYHKPLIEKFSFLPERKIFEDGLEKSIESFGLRLFKERRYDYEQVTADFPRDLKQTILNDLSKKNCQLSEIGELNFNLLFERGLDKLKIHLQLDMLKVSALQREPLSKAGVEQTQENEDKHSLHNEERGQSNTSNLSMFSPK